MNANPVADRWLESPLGAAVLELEMRLLQDELADVVGFEMLQIGEWGDSARLCAAARTQHRTCIGPGVSGPRSIRAHFDALPVATASIEAVLLPHTLEHAPRPHELLREVDRVLVGDGNLVICGFNPWSSWGARHHFAAGGRPFPPHADRLLSEHRVRDWLGLLGFEITTVRRFLFAPPWAQRMFGLGRDGWLERRGPHIAAPLAGAYLLKARKRVRSMTPIRPAWTNRAVLVGGAPEPTTRQAA